MQETGQLFRGHLKTASRETGDWWRWGREGDKCCTRGRLENQIECKKYALKTWGFVSFPFWRIAKFAGCVADEKSRFLTIKRERPDLNFSKFDNLWTWVLKSQEPHGDSKSPTSRASVAGPWPDNWQSKAGGMCQTVLAENRNQGVLKPLDLRLSTLKSFMPVFIAGNA